MSGRILVGNHDGVYVIRFEGDVRVTLAGSFDHYIAAMLAEPKFVSVLVDLSGAIGIDSTSLGGLAKLSIEVQRLHHKLPTLMCSSQDILRVLVNMGFDDIFAMVDNGFAPQQGLAELPLSNDMSEAEMRDTVIEAHKILMQLNESNAATFSDLVKALEAEKRSAARTPPLFNSNKAC